ARADGVLVLPGHGGHRPPDDRLRRRRGGAGVSAAAVRCALVSALGGADGADRLRGASRRLVRDRGRTPALGGLRPHADGGRGLADRCARRRDLAARLHRGLPSDLHGRHGLHDPPDGAFPRDAERRGRRGRTDSDRRHHARPGAGPSASPSPLDGEAAMLDMPTIWAVIIAVALLAYVILDGFDLGIGILFPLGRDRDERDTMMNSVAPVWDGNETWLVLGGAGLFAAFPLAYSILLTAFYAPVIA